MKIRAVAALATLAAASICQRLPAQSRVGKATKWPAPCSCRNRKPEPLTKQDAKHLLTRLPYVSQDRLRGIRDHFEFDQRVNVWYTFRLTHSPNPEQGLRIDGYEAVNYVHGRHRGSNTTLQDRGYNPEAAKAPKRLATLPLPRPRHTKEISQREAVPMPSVDFGTAAPHPARRQ